MKRVGESKHPCRTPTVFRNQSGDNIKVYHLAAQSAVHCVPARKTAVSSSTRCSPLLCVNDAHCRWSVSLINSCSRLLHAELPLQIPCHPAKTWSPSRAGIVLCFARLRQRTEYCSPERITQDIIRGKRGGGGFFF